MTQTVTVNGHTYSDDGSVGLGMAEGGFRQNLIPMLGDIIVDSAGKVSDATTQAGIATAQANIALGAAASTVTGPGSTGTSTTSLTVGLGSKSLTIQTGKTLYPGMPIVIAASASPDDAMYGPLISYNSATGATVVKVTALHMSDPGTFITSANWTVSLTGAAAVWALINELKGGAIASAATIDLNAATGNYLHLTGSAGPVTTVTLAQGAQRKVTLDSTPTFVHSANLDLLTGANVVGEVGDVVTFRGEGGGVTKVTNWVRASGKALAVVPVTPPGMVRIAGPLTPAVAANFDLLALFGSTYDNLVIAGSGVMPNSGANPQLTFRLANVGGVDSTSNYTTANYGGTSSGTTTSVFISTTRPSSRGCNFEIRLKNVNSSGGLKSFVVESISEPTTASVITMTGYAGAYFGGAVTGMRLYWGTGENFAAVGEIYVYGVSKV